jgi:hypothetical protein
MEPTASGSALNPESGDILAELTKLTERATQRVEKLKAHEAEMVALIPVAEASATTAVFDAQGLLASLVIDEQLGQGLDAVALVRDINIAISKAARPLPSTASDAVPEELPGLFGQIFSGLMSGADPEPVLFSNDLGTVTVTTMWGELLSVECASSWVTGATGESIAAEVLRVCNLALHADDPLRRRKG